MLPNVTAEPRNKKTYKKAAMALWLLHIDDFSKDTLGDKHFPHDEIVSFSHEENFQISTQGRVYLSRQYFRDDIQMICRLRVLYSRIFQPAESDDLRALFNFCDSTSNRRKPGMAFDVANVWNNFVTAGPFICVTQDN
jgi:hypothetical protein